MTTTEQALRPCPFCGSKAEIEEELGVILCEGCGFNYEMNAPREEAISAWNSRATEPIPEMFICAGPRDDTDRQCRNPESRSKLDGYRCRECDGYFCAPCADDHFKFNPLREAAKSAERCCEMQTEAYQNAMANAERLHAELEAVRRRPTAQEGELRKALEMCLDGFEYSRQYVGYKMLPAIPGWTWFDADCAARKALGIEQPDRTHERKALASPQPQREGELR